MVSTTTALIIPLTHLGDDHTRRRTFSRHGLYNGLVVICLMLAVSDSTVQSGSTQQARGTTSERVRPEPLPWRQSERVGSSRHDFRLKMWEMEAGSTAVSNLGVSTLRDNAQMTLVRCEIFQLVVQSSARCKTSHRCPQCSGARCSKIFKTAYICDMLGDLGSEPL